MKKVSLFLGMVLIASFAMAQNSSVISTTGNYNDAFITQGVSNNNTASILQVQSATAAYHALAQISQEASSWGKITQYDTRNYATIGEKQNDRAEIYQNGSVNSSNIALGYGEGSNVGYVEQVGTYNGGYMYTTGHNNGTVADPLTIKQYGNTNGAVIESGWNAPASNYNKASINQNGDLNTSKIRQEGGDVNVARVNQTGKENHADLVQTGSYLAATIDQFGDDENIVNLKQTGGTVNIDQNGTGNEVRGLQTAASAEGKLWAEFAGSTLNVMQLGTENTLDLNSTSSGAFVDVYQNGLQNQSIVKN